MKGKEAMSKRTKTHGRVTWGSSGKAFGGSDLPPRSRVAGRVAPRQMRPAHRRRRVSERLGRTAPRRSKCPTGSDRTCTLPRRTKLKKTIKRCNAPPQDARGIRGKARSADTALAGSRSKVSVGPSLHPLRLPGKLPGPHLYRPAHKGRMRRMNPPRGRRRRTHCPGGRRRVDGRKGRALSVRATRPLCLYRRLRRYRRREYLIASRPLEQQEWQQECRRSHRRMTTARALPRHPCRHRHRHRGLTSMAEYRV